MRQFVQRISGIMSVVKSLNGTETTGDMEGRANGNNDYRNDQ